MVAQNYRQKFNYCQCCEGRRCDDLGFSCEFLRVGLGELSLGNFAFDQVLKKK